MANHMTAAGKNRFQEIKSSGLEFYYQFQVGNLIIPEDHFNNPATNLLIINFLKEHQGWVLGYERYGEEPGHFYINSIDELF